MASEPSGKIFTYQVHPEQSETQPASLELPKSNLPKAAALSVWNERPAQAQDAEAEAPVYVGRLLVVAAASATVAVTVAAAVQ